MATMREVFTISEAGSRRVNTLAEAGPYAPNGGLIVTTPDGRAFPQIIDAQQPGIGLNARFYSGQILFNGDVFDITRLRYPGATSFYEVAASFKVPGDGAIWQNGSLSIVESSYQAVYVSTRTYDVDTITTASGGQYFAGINQAGIITNGGLNWSVLDIDTLAVLATMIQQNTAGFTEPAVSLTTGATSAAPSGSDPWDTLGFVYANDTNAAGWVGAKVTGV